MALTPNLPDVLLASMDARLDGVFTGKPGRIVGYDPAKQIADVQICVKKVYQDEQDERQAEVYPILPSVPVMFLGGGGFRTTYPIAVGDTCLIIFADCAMDAWLHLGGIVDPGVTDRKHSISDGIAIVGLRDRKHALARTPTTMSMGKDGGPTIEIDNHHVFVGGADAGADYTIMATAFMNAMDALITGIKAGLVAAGNTTTDGAAIGVTFQGIADAFDTAAAGFKTAIARVK